MYPQSTIPLGLCQCGCGQATKTASGTDRRRGWIKGQPLRFLHHHGSKLVLRTTIIRLCECGCGSPTERATRTNGGRGQIKGQPVHFLPGHAQRIGAVPPIERFWAKVDKNGPIPAHRPDLGPCWIWLGAKVTGGYGVIKTGFSTHKTRKQSLTHRFSWEVHFGPIPSATPFVLHKCDNPPCPNPGHLFLGTAADNTADMMAKGRQAFGGLAILVTPDDLTVF